MARMSARASHPSPHPMQTHDTMAPNRSSPTQEQIARRAYEIFLARGGIHGRHEEDWLQAERELRLGR